MIMDLVSKENIRVCRKNFLILILDNFILRVVFINLVLCDMANSCPKATYVFGVLQRIYTLFSSSTKGEKVYKTIYIT